MWYNFCAGEPMLPERDNPTRMSVLMGLKGYFISRVAK